MFTIGTASGYAKQMQLRQKWQLKQNGINAPKSPFLMNASPSNKDAKQSTLTAITDKLKSGKRLSGAELEFLRYNNPELYKKVVQIDEERKEYNSRLGKCKTKDEVHKLHSQKVQQLSGDAAIAAQNGDTGALEFISMRAAAIDDAHLAFTSQPKYQSLPSIESEDPDESKKAKEKRA